MLNGAPMAKTSSSTQRNIAELAGAERLLDHVVQERRFDAVLVVRAVDEQAGGADDAAADGGHAQLAHALGECVICQRLATGVRIEPDRFGGSHQVFEVMATVELEELAMHLPELTVRGRELGRLGGLLREGLTRLGHVTVDEAQLARELLAYAFQNCECLDAERTLVVAVFNQRNGGVRRAIDMIVCCDFAGFHERDRTTGWGIRGWRNRASRFRSI